MRKSVAQTVPRRTRKEWLPEYAEESDNWAEQEPDDRAKKTMNQMATIVPADLHTSKSDPGAQFDPLANDQGYFEAIETGIYSKLSLTKTLAPNFPAMRTRHIRRISASIYDNIVIPTSCDH